MTEYASFDDLIAVTPGDGEDFTTSTELTVKVRGLTRAEHLWVGKADGDPEEMEARMLSKGLVEPKLTREQIKQWQAKGAVTAVSEISDKVGALSGFGKDAAKSNVDEVRDGA